MSKRMKITPVQAFIEIAEVLNKAGVTSQRLGRVFMCHLGGPVSLSHASPDKSPEGLQRHYEAVRALGPTVNRGKPGPDLMRYKSDYQRSGVVYLTSAGRKLANKIQSIIERIEVNSGN